MTNAQLQTLLKWAIRYVEYENEATRQICTNRHTGRIHNRTIALDVAKADIWLSRARKAVAKPKAARKPK